MTDYIREEIINGKDECLNKVLQCLEEKSSCYYKKLCEVFGSTEYFDQFKKCYENVQSPGVNDQALSPRKATNHCILIFCILILKFAIPALTVYLFSDLEAVFVP